MTRNDFIARYVLLHSTRYSHRASASLMMIREAEQTAEKMVEVRPDVFDDDRENAKLAGKLGVPWRPKGAP